MFSIFIKLGWFFKAYKKRYLIAISLLVMASVIDVIPPYLIGLAIDQIQYGTLTLRDLYEVVLIYGALIIICYAMNYVWMYQLFGGSFLVERLLRRRMMRHLLRMTPGFYEKNRTGDLMARSTNDLKAISTTAGFGILTLIDSTVYMFVILFMMFFMVSWKLTLAALIPLPIMTILIQRYGKLIHQRFRQAQQAFGEMNDNVLESIAGVRVNRAFVQERRDVERFDRMTDNVLKKNIQVAKVDSLFEPSIKVLVGISYVIGLGYGAYLVFHNALTLGDLIAFNIYLGMLIWPMFAVGELINVLQRGNASLDRINETMSHPAEVQEHEDPVSLQQANKISFNQVSFRYPTSTIDNLKEVSFELKRGQTLGIAGKTGSGKTTLLKQLLREYPPGQGEIRISDLPLEVIEIDRLHSWIGYVPQEQILFSRTVKENILFGQVEATDEVLHRVLQLAALDQDIAMLPQGLETLVGEKGVALSGGQKQRLSIARALLINPDILILDDALSAVDGKTEARIIEHIRRERAGKTTLIVTHRLSAIQHADLILVLDEGRVVEAGTHQQLVSKDGWYKQQYDRQQAEAEGM
jgi:ATP-binding cassette subfamily B protein